jgi:ribosomal-protein-alanine N-acetyltransferase
MTLRTAGAGEAAALAAVHAEAFIAPWPSEAFASLLQSPGVFAVVSEDGGMIGLILMRTVADEAEVLTLAVAPGRQREGAGRTLLEAGLGLAAAAGAREAFLDVAADNTPALRLYEAAGFTEVGRRGGYYRRATGPAIDALVLRRALNSQGA